MEHFKAGTRVRISETYGNQFAESDGSFEELRGTEGTVTPLQSEDYVEVLLEATPVKGYKYLFLPEELEAV